ncbi:toprim domain-containing protein [Patescibacteria group bacterium]|nr:toprim domain-containing protein [Patescibacteria group bacterium]MBP7841569.1 toprim domain-containing protein [Patescibacteria group bacterium]
MDVIALYRLGYPIGVATCGTAITEQHVKMLKRYSDNIIFLFDNDQAGLQATIRGLKLAYEQNIFPKILQLPTGYKDVDELANIADGKELFTQALDGVQDAFVVLFETLKKNDDRNSPVGRQKIVNAMFAIIMAIDSTSIQSHYLQVLAQEL